VRLSKSSSSRNCVYLPIFNAFNTVAGFTFFIVVYYLFNGDTKEAGIWPTLFGV
jgi:hypothetical protein